MLSVFFREIVMSKILEQRIDYIDNTKAVAIFLVIVGHCYWISSIPYLNKVIYSFHMPLFFILSGFFVKSLSFKEAVVKYSKAYLPPYLMTVILSVSVSLYIAFISHQNLGDYIVRGFLAMLWGSGSVRTYCINGEQPPIGPIWFLLALFFANISFSCLKKYGSKVEISVIIVFLFIFSCISNKYYRLPFSIQSGLSALLFVAIGNAIREYEIVLSLKKLHILIKFMLVLIWLLCVAKGGITMTFCVYQLGFIDVIGSVVASIFIMIFISKIKRALSCGRKTLAIFCMHSIVVYQYLTFNNPFKDLCYNPRVNFTIELTFNVAIVFLIYLLISQIPYLRKLYRL